MDRPGQEIPLAGGIRKVEAGFHESLIKNASQSRQMPTPSGERERA
jgi:hypothetical protein